MTDIIDAEKITEVNNKYLTMRAKQDIANKKYRATEKGKEKIKNGHKLWIANKKDDLIYRQDTNLKAKIRYHLRKENKRLLEKDEEIFEKNV